MYCCLLETLSFIELVLLIIRPFVTSGMFVSPILVKAISFFLTLSLDKSSSIAFAFSSKTWQQHENTVAWSGRVEIACQNKDGV